MHECKLCILSKIQHIISRTTTKTEPSIQPFECITINLIQYNSTYNENQWTAHTTCDFINFNIIFTTQYKTTILDIFIQVLHLIKRKYGQKVIFIYIDKKKHL